MLQGNHVTVVTSSFTKSSVFKMFSDNAKTKNWRFHFFPQFRFHDGLVWTVGLTVTNMAAFSNFSSVLWMGCYSKGSPF